MYNRLEGGSEVVACDEILTANGCMTVSTLEIDDLIKYAKSKKAKLIMSGHTCNPDIFNVVDCVYEVDKIRHPYEDYGLQARLGIEF